MTRRHRRQWGGTALYTVFVASAFLGIVLPVHANLHLLYADDFRGWARVLAEVPFAERVLRVAPALDLRNVELDHFTTVRWKSSRLGYLRYYTGYAAFNFLILCLLYLFRRRVRKWLDVAARWGAEPSCRYARVLVLTTVVVSGVSYQTKMYLGFWVPGISGWTYQGRLPAIRESISDSSLLQIEHWNGRSPEFLEAAVIGKNARAQRRSGYLTRTAMFLHYRGGQTLPANLGLLNLVFPQYVFGERLWPTEHERAFVEIIRASLDRLHNNRRFALPLSIAYPNHSVYMSVDYETYPRVGALDLISFWTLTIQIDSLGNTSVVGAKNELVLHAR